MNMALTSMKLSTSISCSQSVSPSLLCYVFLLLYCICIHHLLITEPTEPPPTPPGTIVGIAIGVTVAVVIILLFILHKNGTLKRWKVCWDKFVDDTRRRLRSLDPRQRVRHRPTYVCRHIEYCDLCIDK